MGYVSTSRALHQVVAEQRAKESAEEAEALAKVDALRRAEISQMPALIDGLKPLRAEIVPKLRQLLQQPDLDEKERLRLSLAMLVIAEDEGQVAYLSDRLLTAEPAEFLVIRLALLPHRDELAAGIWPIAEDLAAAKDHRFRAVCALAAFDPESPRWTSAADHGYMVPAAAEMLVAENPLVAGTWVEALRPVRQSLFAPLQAIFGDRQRGDSERLLAANILADYAADRPQTLGRSAHGRRREAVRHYFHEIQGSRQGWPEVVARRNREANARRRRRSVRSIGPAAGECSGRSDENEHS